MKITFFVMGIFFVLSSLTNAHNPAQDWYSTFLNQKNEQTIQEKHSGDKKISAHFGSGAKTNASATYLNNKQNTFQNNILSKKITTKKQLKNLKRKKN